VFSLAKAIYEFGYFEKLKLKPSTSIQLRVFDEKIL
jgi:hypothetical protein